MNCTFKMVDFMLGVFYHNKKDTANPINLKNIYISLISKMKLGKQELQTLKNKTTETYLNTYSLPKQCLV